MRELVPAVKALWAGDYAHEGEFYSFPMTTTAPLPQQEGGPPIWIAAREANSNEFAIKNGCNVQVTPLWNGDDSRWANEIVRRRCDEFRTRLVI